MGTALGECLKGRVDLAVPHADLLVIHVIEGYGLGQGQEMLLAPVPMERLGHGGRIVLAAIMTEVGPWRGGALPGEDGPNDRYPGLTRQIADDMLRVMCICVRAFCLCWMCWPAEVSNMARCRRELRSMQT
jgi:hypothetical protein